MAAERCPLCQSKLKNGECESCGYRLPDEGGISAYYNYDPSDYPQEQPAVREITPEHQVEEIYPNRPEPIDFKVRDDQGKTVPASGQNGQQYYGTNSPYGQYPQQGQYGGQQGQQGTPYYRTNSPYGQYRQQGQYGGQPGQPYYRTNGQQGQYQQTGQYGGWPYVRNNNGNPYSGNNPQGTGGTFPEFLKQYWWLFLIIFLIPAIGPMAGILIYSRNKHKINQKYHWIIIVAIILGFLSF